MYASSSDEKSGLLVGVYAGAVADADQAQCIASIVASDARAAARRVVHTCVLVADKDTPSPHAIWRRRMAEANNAMIATRYYFALVTPKLMHRGAFTAITWITRGREGHHLAAFGDLAPASAWVQANAGHTAVEIQRLYAQASSQLSAGAQQRARAPTG